MLFHVWRIVTNYVTETHFPGSIDDREKFKQKSELLGYSKYVHSTVAEMGLKRILIISDFGFYKLNRMHFKAA